MTRLARGVLTYRRETTMILDEIIHTPGITCREDTSLAEVAREMDEHRVGSIVVVDAKGDIAGIVTDRDVTLRGMAKERDPRSPVREIMTRNVVSIQDDADVFDAARQMAESGCRRLPVIGVDGKLKGVVALDDLIVLFTRHADDLTRAVAGEFTNRVRYA
jgi:signal-transduction protein with cAMP-binding, CBS, and nucleotidyltransferase domain